MKADDHRRIFEQESLAFEATELVCALLKGQGVMKAELANRMGKSKSYVTQLLSGSRNMTLHTFADLAFALGQKVEIKFVPALGSRSSESVVTTVTSLRFNSTPYRSKQSEAPSGITLLPPEDCGEESVAA